MPAKSGNRIKPHHIRTLVSPPSPPPTRNHREEDRYCSKKKKNAHNADESLIELMGRRGPILSPRHDQPQVNLNPEMGRDDCQARHKKKSHAQNEDTKTRTLSPAPSRKKHYTSSSRNDLLVESLDEASQQAHIVQRVEMEMKKNRRSSRSGVDSLSQSSPTARKKLPPNTKKNGRKSSDHVPLSAELYSIGSSCHDENYEMIQPPPPSPPSGGQERYMSNRDKSQRAYNSSGRKQQQPQHKSYGHHPKTVCEAPKPTSKRVPHLQMAAHKVPTRSYSKHNRTNSSSRKNKNRKNHSGVFNLHYGHTINDNDDDDDGCGHREHARKREFQVIVDQEHWINATFSDPTMATFERNHFLGQEQCQPSQLLEAWRPSPRHHLEVGADNDSIAVIPDNGLDGHKSDDSKSGVLDRICEKKTRRCKEGIITRIEDSDDMAYKKLDDLNRQVAEAKRAIASTKARQKSPAELISFDDYEPEDEYYYEDEEDVFPMFPAGRPPTATPQPMSPMSGTVNTTDVLQLQMQEIKRLQKDIQRQQAKMKKNSERILPYRDDVNTAPAKSYQLAIAIQNQEELRRLEITQKALMLEKRMALYKKSQKQLQQQRTLTCSPPAEAKNRGGYLVKGTGTSGNNSGILDNRSKTAVLMDSLFQNDDSSNEESSKGRERGKVVPNDGRSNTNSATEIQQKSLFNDSSNDDIESKDGISKDSSDDSSKKSSQEIAEESSHETPSITESIHNTKPESNERTTPSAVSAKEAASEQPSLYEKVAMRNKLAELSEEDQKVLEAEILMELKVELSKRATEKKMLHKPKFLSGKRRLNEKAEQDREQNNPSKPVEELTEELSRQIQKLNFQMSSKKKHLSMPKFKLKRQKEASKITESGGKNTSHFHCEDDDEIESIQSEKNNENKEEERDEESDDESDDETEGIVPEKRLKVKSFLNALGLRKKHVLCDSDRRCAEIVVHKAPCVQVLPIKQIRTSYAYVSEKSGEQPTSGGRVLYNPEDPPKENLSKDSNGDHFSELTKGDKKIAPEANSSNATQLTPDAVFIGVANGAIETLSFSSRGNRPLSPASTRVSCSSRDRYEYASHGTTIITSGEKSKVTMCDDPSIYEYLEVEYCSHTESQDVLKDSDSSANILTDTAVNAPVDERIADARKSIHS